MIIPRSYQQEGIDKTINFLEGSEQGNPLLVYPTGAGKSVVIAKIAEYIANKGKRLLVFQPQKEILQQNYDKYVAYGYQASVYSASMNSKNFGDVTFATIGSVASKPELFKGYDYILVDEAHTVDPYNGRYKTFFDHLNKKVIGLTATPYRLYSNSFGACLRFTTRTNPRVFDTVLHYVQNDYLFKEGYLAKLEYEVDNQYDISRLQVNSTGSDFTDESVRQYQNHIDFDHKLFKKVKELMERGRKPLVFTRFIADSELLIKNLGEGVILTGATPHKQRQKIVEDYRIGKIPVLANVGVADTGCDFPLCDSVVIASATRSLARYTQKVGRGVRIHPDKKDCVVVDLCGNYNTFGRVEDLNIHRDKNGRFGVFGIVNGKHKQLTNVNF